MRNLLWLFIVISSRLTAALQRWLLLDDTVCQGCNQFYAKDAEFMSLLFVSSKNIILGGRNKLHSVDLVSDVHTTFLDDSQVLETSVETCVNEGRIEGNCQNYYKVLLMLSETDVMTCGTWGFAPKCDVRSVNELDFGDRAHVRSGNGFCPANPAEPTSYIKLDGDIGFAGTCTDACTSDAITRFNLQPGSLSGTSRTFDTTDMLSDPKFVYSFQEGDYVYFVFRELANELATEKIYSRIGRICKNDVGSSSVFSNHWFLSYYKARFFCTSYQAGQQPFDHDELDGAVYRDGVLYATFSGPKNLRTGSVVCSYTIAAIDEVFEGSYLTFNNEIREWETSPNQNYNCGRKKGEQEAIKYYLMSSSVDNMAPLFATDSNERLSAMTADSFTYNDDDIMVLYAASDIGRVHRIAFVKDMDSKVFHTSYKVGEGEVTKITYGEGHVYAMGHNWLTSIPVKQDCAASSCGECMETHFPYCGWCYDVNLGDWSCSVRNDCSLRNWIPPSETCKPLPTFSRVPVNKTLHEGYTAQFKCTSHDSNVVCSKDGGPLPLKAGYQNQGSIYIPEVKLEDSGNYECSVNNTSGVVTAKAYLYVQVPARFRLQPTNVSVTYGHQDLVLSCRAQGLPKPEIRWERTNGALPDGSQVLPSGDLKIIRVMKEDEGGYVCYIRNNVGGERQSETAFVTVFDTANPYSPAADESSYDSGLSETVLITVICFVVLLVCFVVGLAVHRFYKKRNVKRDLFEEGGIAGTYAPFQGYPGVQDDAGYLCPSQPWQSFHRHQTGLSQDAFTPETAMTSLMTDDEAPPAYTLSQNNLSGSQWLHSTTSSSSPNSRDYAQIMTVPMRPPPISPPLPPFSTANQAPYCHEQAISPPLPPFSVADKPSFSFEQPLATSSLPFPRDFVPQSTTAFTPIHVGNSTQSSRLNQDHTSPVVSEYCSKLEVSSAI